MGFLVRIFSILAGLAVGFAGYFVMAAEGWPQPLEDMRLERQVLGGLVMLAGVACVWSGFKPRRKPRSAARRYAPEPTPAVRSEMAEPEPEPEPAPSLTETDSAAVVLAAPTLAPVQPDSEPKAPGAIGELLPQGDKRFAVGRLDEALDPYSEALDLARRAHAADPDNADATRTLARTLKTNADVYDDQGRMDTAIDLYEESLKLCRGLAQGGAPSDRRALSVLLERLGDCREARGHRSRAVDLYRESLAIAESLAQAEPSNTLYAEDLTVTRRRLDELESVSTPA